MRTLLKMLCTIRSTWQFHLMFFFSGELHLPPTRWNGKGRDRKFNKKFQVSLAMVLNSLNLVQYFSCMLHIRSTFTQNFRFFFSLEKSPSRPGMARERENHDVSWENTISLKLGRAPMCVDRSTLRYVTSSVVAENTSNSCRVESCDLIERDKVSPSDLS